MAKGDKWIDVQEFRYREQAVAAKNNSKGLKVLPRRIRKKGQKPKGFRLLRLYRPVKDDRKDAWGLPLYVPVFPWREK